MNITGTETTTVERSVTIRFDNLEELCAFYSVFDHFLVCNAVRKFLDPSEIRHELEKIVDLYSDEYATVFKHFCQHLKQ